MIKEVFNRNESKYILNKDTYNLLMDSIKKYITHDEYPKSTICNIYFDTDNYDLISHSIEKPIYKEKVRLRSYNVPSLDDYVFLEIKKKFNKVVNKRRIKISLKDYYEYLDNKKLNVGNKQIKSEIDYIFKMHDLKPKMFIAYDRLCFIDKSDNTFRITFDRNIRSRDYDLKLEDGDDGIKYFEDGKIIMEVKAINSYPMWFLKILSNLNIKPTSFSKYGSIYIKKRKDDELCLTV